MQVFLSAGNASESQNKTTLMDQLKAAKDSGSTIVLIWSKTNIDTTKSGYLLINRTTMQTYAITPIIDDQYHREIQARLCELGYGQGFVQADGYLDDPERSAREIVKSPEFAGRFCAAKQQ